MIGIRPSQGEIGDFSTTSLRIGSVTAPNRVILAPMSGITDAPFRRLAQRLGAGLVVSEMTACAALAEGQREARVRSDGQGVAINVVQLAGCEAHWMAEGARIVEAQGAHIIDINMGCPSKQVTNGASGSALMRDLDHALTLIEATVNAVKIPVTLKMRLGWDADSINAPALAQRAEAAGVQMITVHGRTRCQFYTGNADWTAVRPVKEAVAFRSSSMATSVPSMTPSPRSKPHMPMPSWSDAPRKAVPGCRGRWRIILATARTPRRLRWPCSLN